MTKSLINKIDRNICAEILFYYTWYFCLYFTAHFEHNSSYVKINAGTINRDSFSQTFKAHSLTRRF